MLRADRSARAQGRGAKLEEEDISAEIVDLRSIKPLDEKAIFDSVAKTHRVVIVEQDHPFCGVGAEVCYRIQKNIFDELDAPIHPRFTGRCTDAVQRASRESRAAKRGQTHRGREESLLRMNDRFSASTLQLLTLSTNPMPEIQMPKLSDTMTEGTLVAWKKKKGDKVSAGEVLAEIETDKATMEWESPEDGTLTEIYVEEGGKVNVGDKIAFIGGEGEEAPRREEGKEKEKKKKSRKAEEEERRRKRRAEARRRRERAAAPGREKSSR
mgnify:CR=1 FL=1